MTTILKNFPNGSQRVTVREDGTRDINADFDCVQQCIADALTWFTGKLFQAGVIKQVLYGYSYQGGTSAAADIGYCAHFGVRLYPIDASAPTLIADIHQQIQNQHPVIITEPDPYSSTPGWTHCIIMHEEGPGYLVAADPFIAANITKRDSEWAQDLAVREIWVLAPMKEVTTPVGIDLATPGISAHFKAGAGDSWDCTNGNTIHGAILTYYRTAFNALCGGLTVLGLPTSNEINQNVEGHPEIVRQKFEYGEVQYNPQHIGGAQPGAGAVYTVRPEQPPAPPVAPAVDTEALNAANAKAAALEAKLAQIVKDAQL